MTLDNLLDALFARTPEEEAQALADSRQQVSAALARNSFAYDSLDWRIAERIWFAVGEKGLVAVQMGGIGEDEFLASQSGRLKGTLYRDEARTAEVKQQLREYLDGARHAFDLPIDWRHMTDFQATVLRGAQQIPAGQVLSYGELAQKIGRPKAARAVGRALGTNPMPIIIPCHRVLASDGSLTGYIGGTAVKAHLLQLEGYVA
jgi:O-6-methylguanine DNA methyltransferase